MEQNQAIEKILDMVQQLAVDQAVLKEKVEAHLEVMKGHKEEHDKLDDVVKDVHTQGIFMKASLWVYAALISTFGFNWIHTKL